MIGVLVIGLMVAFVLLVLQGLIAGSTITASNTYNATSVVAPQGSGASGVLANPQTTNSQTASETLNYGTSANQANLHVVQTISLTVSGGATPTATLDLFGGTLLDPFGNACVFLHVKMLQIWISAGGDTSGVTVGNAGSNPFLGNMGGTTPTQKVYPGGLAMQMGEPNTGFVVSSTVRNILITNNSATQAVTVQVLIAGTTT